jgi:hypothetical protein
MPWGRPRARSAAAGWTGAQGRHRDAGHRRWGTRRVRAGEPAMRGGSRPPGATRGWRASADGSWTFGSTMDVSQWAASPVPPRGPHVPAGEEAARWGDPARRESPAASEPVSNPMQQGNPLHAAETPPSRVWRGGTLAPPARPGHPAGGGAALTTPDYAGAISARVLRGLPPTPAAVGQAAALCFPGSADRRADRPAAGDWAAHPGPVDTAAGGCGGGDGGAGLASAPRSTPTRHDPRRCSRRRHIPEAATPSPPCGPRPLFPPGSVRAGLRPAAMPLTRDSWGLERTFGCDLAV